MNHAKPPIDDLGSAALELLRRQRGDWPMLSGNYAALDEVRLREIKVGDLLFRLQFNPARVVSSGAKVDAAAVAARPCFLCAANRPGEQTGLPFCDRYEVLANPFPILPEHFTVPLRQHLPQAIDGRFADLLELARRIGPRLFAFYNGPRCGASAPDHMHFQAGTAGVLPIEAEVDELTTRYGRKVDAVTTFVAEPLRPFFLIESIDAAESARALARLLTRLPQPEPGHEPMINLLAYHRPGGFRTIVIPRRRHRPSFYDAPGIQRIMLSPGALDMGGLCVCPMVGDFDRLTDQHLRQMLAEVCWSVGDLGM